MAKSSGTFRGSVMLLSPVIGIQTADSLKAQFLFYSEAVSNIFSKQGAHVRPYISRDLAYFSSHTNHGMEEILSSLIKYHKVCVETFEHGKEAASNRMFVWRALKNFNFIPSSDLLYRIGPNDVIEIYDSEMKQIFRNLRFFELCSYSLEDVFCRPWTDLFIRTDETVVNRIFKHVEKFFRKEHTGVIDSSDIGTHTIDECDSPFKFRLEANIRHIGGLVNKQSELCGLMAIESAEIINRPERHMEEILLAAYYKDKGLI